MNVPVDPKQRVERAHITQTDPRNGIASKRDPEKIVNLTALDDGEVPAYTAPEPFSRSGARALPIEIRTIPWPCHLDQFEIAPGGRVVDRLIECAPILVAAKDRLRGLRFLG